MNSFKYVHPVTIDKASKAAAGNEALLSAGGTDLLGLMKHNIEQPKTVVNLKKVPDLDFIQYQSGTGLRIGALTRIATIAEHKIIREKYTALAEAAAVVASPQLRNMGTLGGNLCQRPRCWYYRGDFHCLRKGGDTCFAVGGENKYHCVIGGDPCFIVHPSDTAVALLALEARLKIYASSGRRELPLAEFFVLPEQDVRHENILQPGEIISEIILPDIPAETGSGFIKFRERSAWDFAVVSVAAVIEQKAGRINRANIVLGGVAPVPWLEKQVSSKLSGRRLAETDLQKVADTVLAEAYPMEQNEYKVVLARNLTGRLLRNLMHKA